jgi:hypothetical protein
LDPIPYVLFSRCIGWNQFPAFCRIVWNFFVQNISRSIGWNQLPAVLVGTNSLLFCFSRCIGWNQFPAVLIGTNVPPFWLELFPAKYFSLYWLKSISRRIGWNHFLVVLFFPMHLLEPISRRIDWNHLPAVFVGTNFMPPYLLLP